MSDQNSSQDATDFEVKAAIRKAALAVAKRVSENPHFHQEVAAAAAFFSAPAVADALTVSARYYTPSSR